MKKIEKVELLAPAGDLKSLKSAISCGADAVYLGHTAFSARSKAANFEGDALAAAIRTCHLHGVKVYLALNTLIKPDEQGRAISVAKEAYACGADAFIVQDLTFLTRLKSELPNAVVHLSTQVGVHNLEGAIAARALGVRRVVLSRETLLEDIVAIHEKTDLELEFFVHGALCVAFSGNCYFSSLAAGLSGNRGRCLQLCRKRYSAAGKRGYLLSAGDLDLSRRIEELAAAGVVSLKIEGRMRRPEYVAAATRYYRNILDGVGRDPSEVNRVFARGEGCEAYLTDPTANVIFPDIQGHMGVKVGKVQSVRGGKAVLSLSSVPKRGDGYKFVRGGLEVGSTSVTADGNTVSFTGSLCAGDDVRITTDSELMKRLAAIEKKIPVSVSVRIEEERPLVATAVCHAASVTVESDFVAQKALTEPITAGQIEECFSRCGDTEFRAEKVTVETKGDCFVVRSALNSFRREVYARLDESILSGYNRALEERRKTDGPSARVTDAADAAYFGAFFDTSGKKGDNSASNAERESFLPERLPGSVRSIVCGESADVLKAAAEIGRADAVAYSPAFYNNGADEIANLKRAIGVPVYVVLPIMARGGDREVLKNIVASDADGFIVNNLCGLELARGRKIILGPMMNRIDPRGDCDKILSPEYDGREYGDAFVYAFGRFPLMTFAHCPLKTVNGGKCLGCGERRRALTVKDEESGREFPIRFYKVLHCYASLLNCLPIDLTREKEVAGARKFIDLVGFSKKECYNILESLGRGERLAAEATRGFYSRRLV